MHGTMNIKLGTLVFSVREHVLNKSISMEICQFNPHTISNTI